LGHVLGDHKGLVYQFDLLQDFLPVGDRPESVGSIHRTARQLMQDVVIDLRGGKSGMLMFRMTRLAPDFPTLARAGLLRRGFDNVTGGRFGGIAGMLLGGGQGLNQLRVFGG
jgi:hypothetical protein